jgi:di/tricarboxylate transporter
MSVTRTCCKELAILPGATIVGRSASDLRLRTRYGLNLLPCRAKDANHRPGFAIKLKSGDLLLMQGPADDVAFINNDTGVPLGETSCASPTNGWHVAGAIMVRSALSTLACSPAPVGCLGVLASMLLRTVPLRKIYTTIDWPIIVLLAALIPCGRDADDRGR